MAEEIEANGTTCGRYKARTLMKMAGVSAKQKRKFKATTDSNHNDPVAPNLLNREFRVEVRWYGFNGHVHKSGIKSHKEVFNEEET